MDELSAIAQVKIERRLYEQNQLNEEFQYEKTSKKCK